MEATYLPKALPDCLGGRRFRLDRDFTRLVQVLPRNAFHFLRHGCREQGHLAIGRRLLENPRDLVDKAHAQHLVRLIEHECLELVEFQRAFAHVIHDAPGRAHNNLHPTAQLANLPGVLLSAVDRQDVESLDVFRVALECLGHLDREFARRCERHYLDVLALHIESREQWQGKSRGLAGTGWCMAEQIVPVQQVRYRLRLDGRGRFIANLVKRLYQGCGELQLTKRRGFGLGFAHGSGQWREGARTVSLTRTFPIFLSSEHRMQRR